MRNTKFLTLCLIVTVLTACSTNNLNVNTPEDGMFNISILYPAGKDKTFDMNYYENNHMPMMAKILGKNLKFYEIDKGESGRTPTDEAPFVAIGHFYCYDAAAYGKAIAENRDSIINDIKKYTNIQPVVQVSKIRQIKNNDGN